MMDPVKTDTGHNKKAYPMLKIKRMIRSDLFWSLTGGFAIGAIAVVSLVEPETDYSSMAQAPVEMVDQI